jgi:diacylglycerol O-acyltransferase
MRRLSLVDAGFLAAETREVPMHVGGLQLFSPPTDAGPDYMADLYQSWVDTLDIRRPFNQKLAIRFGVPHWAIDPELDLEYHLRHSALPRPGRFRELFALVSRLHGSLLSRSRALWEFHLIEGLADGRWAMYTKMHHAVIDGVGSMRLLERSLSRDPDDRSLVPPWAARSPARADRQEPRSTKMAVAALTEQLRVQIGSVPGVARALRKLVQTALDPASNRMALPFAAPRTPLNRRISGARRFVAQSYSLERVRGVARQIGGTINDVVLAMSSSALRRYLDEHGGGVPERPLTAMVPVSVRPSDAGELGNAISAVLVNLGTHLADPAERFDVIRTSMADAKALVAELTHSEIMLYTMLASGPLMAPALMGLSTQLPPFNVVVSNVPGPRETLYWNGARLDGMYPASIVTHGLGVNITVTSYAGSLDFGIIACRRTVPQVQRLIDYLAHGLEELEALA